MEIMNPPVIYLKIIRFNLIILPSRGEEKEKEKTNKHRSLIFLKVKYLSETDFEQPVHLEIYPFRFLKNNPNKNSIKVNHKFYQNVLSKSQQKLLDC